MTMLPDQEWWAVVIERPNGTQINFTQSPDRNRILDTIDHLNRYLPQVHCRLARLRVMEIGLVDPKPTTIKPKIRGVEEPCFNQADLTEPDEIDECWAPDCGAKCDWENCYDGRESPMYKRYDAWTRGEELGEGPDESEGGEA